MRCGSGSYNQVWQLLDQNADVPCYILPNHRNYTDDLLGDWDSLAGWAESNGWEFCGFFLSKSREVGKPHTPFYNSDGEVKIRPFAKFIKVRNDE